VNSVYIYQIGQPLNWDNGSTTSPAITYSTAVLDRCRPASITGSQHDSCGVALPAFDTQPFRHQFGQRLRVSHPHFFDDVPNVRQDAINEWDRRS